MSLVQQQLRDLVVTAIKNASTDAGQNVFSPRDRPTRTDIFPIIIVTTPEESKESLGRNVPQFTTTVTVRITARVKMPAVATAMAPDDGGSLEAELALESLKNEIEVAVINDYNTRAAIQQYAFVRSRIDIDASGEYHIGELTQDYGLETYEGPELFAPPVAVPLDRITWTDTSFPDGTTQPAIDLPNLQS